MLDRSEDPRGDERRIGDQPPAEPPEPAALLEAFGLDQARVDRVDRDAARGELDRQRARERELACFDAEYGPPATVPATETMLTMCEPRPSPGRNARTVQSEPR